MGQKKSDKHQIYITYVFLIISIIVSYIQQKLSLGVYGVIAGTLLAALVN